MAKTAKVDTTKRLMTIRCGWCGTIVRAEDTTTLTLNFGRETTVCPKCWSPA